jgi:hypothetical protein
MEDTPTAEEWQNTNISQYRPRGLCFKNPSLVYYIATGSSNKLNVRPAQFDDGIYRMTNEHPIQKQPV